MAKLFVIDIKVGGKMCSAIMHRHGCTGKYFYRDNSLLSFSTFLILRPVASAINAVKPIGFIFPVN